MDICNENMDDNSTIIEDEKNMGIKHNFRDKWLEMKEFQGWLKKSSKKKGHSEFGYCTICDDYVVAHKSCLIRHMNTAKHKKNETKIVSAIDRNKISTTKENKVKRAELKIAAFVAENNLPFKVVDSLVPLCKDIFPDSEIVSKIASKRTKTTHIIKKAVGNNLLNNLYNKLKAPGMFFSVIMDESTDESSKKQCALTVIYTTSEHKVKYNFFDMFEITSSTAEDLYCYLKNSISSKGIPFENVVGFSSDTTNCMVGEYNSVFSHLKEDLPDIICIKCTCHMIHLVASKACLKLPRTVEDLLRNLGSHFNRSYFRQEKLIEFQKFFSEPIRKILSPSHTRWLSVKECVDRVLEQYIPVKAYLTKLCDSGQDPSHTTQSMLAAMENCFTKAYLEFMSYVLEILNDFNKLFQSEIPLLHALKPQVQKMLKDICSNFLTIDYIKGTPILELNHKNRKYFETMDNIYIGMSATETLNEIKQMPNVRNIHIREFYDTILNFYIELVSVVKDKFEFRDSIYEIISFVDPQVAQEYKNKSLVSVWKRFPILRKFINIQELDKEWKTHALLDHHQEGLYPTLPAHIYWEKVFSLRTALGRPAFPNLCTTIKLLLVLPFSNASVERIFSTMKNCKTVHRNCLKTDTLVCLIATKEAVGENHNGCVGFEPSAEMYKSNIWEK